jgi:predicted  nucleic acid-binding Zn-ribbon protein
MLIEHLSKEFEKLATNIEEGRAPFDQQQALILKFYEKRIAALERKLEEVKDEISDIKANGK